MDETNKPEVTNPSSEEGVNQEIVAQESDKTPEEQAFERVAEGISNEKKEFGTLKNLVNPESSEGGSKDVDSHSESSKSDDADAALLTLVSTTTGRNFTSVEEAKKHLSNLNSLVGDQTVAKSRKLADQYQKLVSGWATKNGVTAEAAEKFLADQFVTVAAQESQQTQKPVANNNETDDRTRKLEETVERLQLVGKYPEADQYVEEVSMIAKAKKISWLQAYEQSPIKELAAIKAREDSTKNPIVTPSNRKGFDTKKVEALGKKLLSHRGNADDAVSLVTELLGLDK